LAATHFLPPDNINDSCIEVRLHSGIVLDYEISDLEEVIPKGIFQSRLTVKRTSESLVIAVGRES